MAEDIPKIANDKCDELFEAMNDAFVGMDTAVATTTLMATTTQYLRQQIPPHLLPGILHGWADVLHAVANQSESDQRAAHKAARRARE